MFEVTTDDPALLRRSLQYGIVGIVGALLLSGWHLWLGLSAGFDSYAIGFLLVGVGMLTLFGVRTVRGWQKYRRLSARN